MFTLPLPRIVAGSVIAMIAIAAVLTFTRGESPATDTASATLPGVSGTTGPVVESATTKPSSPASADAAEREAENADSKGTTKAPAKTPTQSGPTTTPTTTPPKDPEPEPKPEPTQSPKPPCGLLTAILGGCK